MDTFSPYKTSKIKISKALFWAKKCKLISYSTVTFKFHVWLLLMYVQEEKKDVATTEESYVLCGACLEWLGFRI